MQNNLKIWYFSAVIEDKKSCFLLLYTALSHHLLNLCRRSISPWLTIATWRALTHSFQTLLTFTRVKYLSRCTPFPLPDNNGSSSNVSWKRRPCRLLRHVVVHWLWLATSSLARFSSRLARHARSRLVACFWLEKQNHTVVLNYLLVITVVGSTAHRNWNVRGNFLFFSLRYK